LLGNTLGSNTKLAGALFAPRRLPSGRPSKSPLRRLCWALRTVITGGIRSCGAASSGSTARVARAGWRAVALLHGEAPGGRAVVWPLIRYRARQSKARHRACTARPACQRSRCQSRP